MMQTPQFFHLLTKLFEHFEVQLSPFTVHFVSSLVKRVFIELEVCKRTQRTITNHVIEKCLTIIG
jgi:hypothetical protein